MRAHVAAAVVGRGRPAQRGAAVAAGRGDRARLAGHGTGRGGGRCRGIARTEGVDDPDLDDVLDAVDQSGDGEGAGLRAGVGPGTAVEAVLGGGEGGTAVGAQLVADGQLTVTRDDLHVAGRVRRAERRDQGRAAGRTGAGTVAGTELHGDELAVDQRLAGRRAGRDGEGRAGGAGRTSSPGGAAVGRVLVAGHGVATVVAGGELDVQCAVVGDDVTDLGGTGGGPDRELARGARGARSTTVHRTDLDGVGLRVRQTGDDE